MKDQATLIGDFVNGATRGTASNMFVADDVLYSYGNHFPLLVRMSWGFLLNADKYSSTTSKHQSSCFRHATIQIPFSALRSAGVPFRDVELVDHEAQRYDWTGKYSYHVDGEIKTIGKGEYEALNDVQKLDCYKQEERRPESAVISDGRNKGMIDQYLSSMDGNNFFLCMLPEYVETVAEAFASLKPKEVKDDNYQRQGEWFFVETDEMPIFLLLDGKPILPDKVRKLVYKGMTPNFVLPNRDPDGNDHIATRGLQIGNSAWVSGQIRHRTRWGGRGDHRMLRLSTLDNIKIFLAFENRALASWSAGGSVD